MRSRKTTKKGKSLTQRKHENAIRKLYARCPAVYGKKRGKLRTLIYGDVDAQLQIIEDKITSQQESLEKMQEKILIKKEKKVNRTLRKRDKKLRGDKTPYRLIIIKDGVITEKDYDAPGFAKLHVPASKKDVWTMDVVKYGKVEAKILDLDNHISKNSDNTKLLTVEDERELGRLKYIDDKASSFQSYHSLMVLAGASFGFSMAMAVMWIIKAVLMRALS